MRIDGNTITITAQKNVTTLQPNPVKSNFQNLLTDKTPVPAPVKVEGSAVSIRPTIAPISITPVGIVSYPTDTIKTPVASTPSPIAAISIKPVGIATNVVPITSPMPSVKLEGGKVVSIVSPPSTTVKSQPNVVIKTKIYDAVDTIPYVNVWVEGVAVTGSDINGNVELKDINANSLVEFSFVGYKTASFIAKNVPSKIVLQNDDMLNEVVIKNGYVAPTPADKKKTPSWVWVLVLLGGVVIYKGYKYSTDKTKRIVKTKI